MPVTLNNIAALPTVEIPGVEICRVGRWNARQYTAAEFDEAAQTAHELSADYHIPLKLGHDDDQHLSQTDGYPSIGWVENVKRIGDRLIGDFKNVPEKLAQLIKSGAYRGRSCEFWTDTEYAGKRRNIMLSAVSLLGVDAPAVESMSDMIALYNKRLSAGTVTLTDHTNSTITATTDREAAMPTANLLARLPEASRVAYDAWRTAHVTKLDLISGPPMSDIQSAVEKALASSYPPAMGAEDNDTPGADGPSQNVLDWFVSGSDKSVIVSDQEVDNLFEIPFTYDASGDTATLGNPIPVKGTYTANTTGTESSGEDADDTPPADAAAAPAGGDTMQMAHQLAAQVADTAVEALVTEAEAEFDKLLAAVNGIASGKPGVAEFRAMLDAAKKSMGRIKIAKPSGDAPTPTAKAPEPTPKPPETAQNSRQEEPDVKLSALAKIYGLPETATEDEVLRAAEGAAASRGVVTTLARKVDALLERDAEKEIDAMLDRAVEQGRLKRWNKPGEDGELYLTLKQLAKTDMATAQTIIAAQPKFVDTTEYGASGNQGEPIAAEVKPGVAHELRRLGRDPESINPASLETRWKTLLTERQTARAAKNGLPAPDRTPLPLGR